MNKTRLIIFMGLSIVFISGCEDKTSMEWYRAHHDDMLAKYEECLKTQTWQAPDCRNASTAVKREEGKSDVDAGLKAISERHMSKVKSL